MFLHNSDGLEGYLVADVDFHAVLQVFQSLLQVPSPGGAKIAGIRICLKDTNKNQVLWKDSSGHEDTNTRCYGRTLQDV